MYLKILLLMKIMIMILEKISMMSSKRMTPTLPRGFLVAFSSSFGTDEFVETQTPASSSKMRTVSLAPAGAGQQYDHRGDTGRDLEFAGEEASLAADPRFSSIVDQLHAMVLGYIRLY